MKRIRKNENTDLLTKLSIIENKMDQMEKRLNNSNEKKESSNQNVHAAVLDMTKTIFLMYGILQLNNVLEDVKKVPEMGKLALKELSKEITEKATSMIAAYEMKQQMANISNALAQSQEEKITLITKLAEKQSNVSPVVAAPSVSYIESLTPYLPYITGAVAIITIGILSYYFVPQTAIYQGWEFVTSGVKSVTKTTTEIFQPMERPSVADAITSIPFENPTTGSTISNVGTALTANKPPLISRGTFNLFGRDVNINQEFLNGLTTNTYTLDDVDRIVEVANDINQIV
jgi:hypothetical protein